MVISTITLLNTIYKRSQNRLGLCQVRYLQYKLLSTIQVRSQGLSSSRPRNEVVFYQRLNLESWFANLEQKPLNRCLQLPAPYKRLIDNINRTDKQ